MASFAIHVSDTSGNPPRPRLIPRVLSSHTLPLAELCAARLDGELIEVGELWVPVDEPDNAELRALSLSAQFGSGGRKSLIACDLTAAWVYGVIPSLPRPISLCTPSTERTRPSFTTRVTLSERIFGEFEIERVADLRITSPHRTVRDLVRGRVWSPIHRDAVRDLSTIYELDLLELRQAVLRRGIFHSRDDLIGRLDELNEV